MFRVVLPLFILLFSLVHPATAQQSIRLMANTSPPYADEQLPEQGLALELVRDMFSRTGHKPEITIENWSRAVEGARLGVYDGLAAAWFSEDRAKDLLFSDPYLTSDLIILKRRADQNDYSRVADLSGGRLGVRVDYAYGVDFDSVPNLTLVRENHLIQNLLNLLNGKIDFVIGDRRTIVQQLHEFLNDKVTQFEVTGITLKPVARHVAISRSLPGHEKIIADFNRGLAQAKKDGTHGAIVKKWDERYGGME